MTRRDVLRMEATTPDPALRFALNWARHQDGPATARRVAELARAGHSVTVAQFGRGYVVDGEYLPSLTLR